MVLDMELVLVVGHMLELELGMVLDMVVVEVVDMVLGKLELALDKVEELHMLVFRIRTFLLF
jgi:hypothetical protein